MSAPVKYEFDILGNYGHGFEMVHCEANRADAIVSIREYRENEPGISFKIKRVKAS